MRHRGPSSPEQRGDAGEPLLLTVDETAALLRTSRKAIYAMIERAQLPGVVRIGKRILVRRADLLRWLETLTRPELRQ